MRLITTVEREAAKALETAKRITGLRIATSSSVRSGMVGMGGAIHDTGHYVADCAPITHSTTLGPRTEQNPCGGNGLDGGSSETPDTTTTWQEDHIFHEQPGRAPGNQPTKETVRSDDHRSSIQGSEDVETMQQPGADAVGSSRSRNLPVSEGKGSGAAGHRTRSNTSRASGSVQVCNDSCNQNIAAAAGQIA